jgi:uncharacterized protein
MKIIKRSIQSQIELKLNKGKIIIIYGPRRSGKTTLSKELIKKYGGSYFNCEEPYIQSKFNEDASSEDLWSSLGKAKLIVLDEAQSIINIGRKLKLLIDNFPNIQIIATGSSSFDLSNKIIEPLTGRKYEFILYPVSIIELIDSGLYNFDIGNLETFLRFGMYPSVIDKPYYESQEELIEITSSYLFKDILQYQNIKNPDILRKLLQALALQIGNEVSYNELANLVGIDKNTVITYLDILEKSFIIFRLNPISRNLRKELSKNRKIYFFDLGIRNALLNQFGEINLRNDVGGLWENFCILERKKYLDNNKLYKNLYFWRTYDQKEIDLVEEKDGKFDIFEFKYSHNKINFAKDWLENYETDNKYVISKNNFSQLFN